MNKQNKFGDDLTSDQDQGKAFATTVSKEASLDNGPTGQWAVELKGLLKKVFVWDLFDKKEAKVRLEYRLHAKKTPVWASYHLWARAAVIITAVISGALLQALIAGSFKQHSYSETVVPLGQMARINLSDGSKIWLNSGSVFKCPTEFDRSSREVFIDGEAFMEVAEDKHKPFVVHAKQFSAEVLGTSFNISAYSAEDNANLTLVEGKVLLYSEDQKWSKTITPGQLAIVTNGKMPEVSAINTDFYTSWKEGKIVFRNETFEEIAKKIERWYNVEIRFKDEALKSLVFSGTFLKYKPVEQVFRSLRIMNHKIDFVYEDRTDQKNIIYIIQK